MSSNSLAARDIASVVHPYTNLKKHLEVGPTIMTHGDGVYIYDDAGNKILDGASGQWCASLGYHNERLAKVAYEAMLRLPYSHLFRHQSHSAAIELSEKLLEIAPVPMSKVLLQCSGSEANDSAVKIVWYYWHGKNQPQRRKIISRMGSYHGTTCAAMSLTGNNDYHRSFGLPLDGFLKTSALNYYRSGAPGESEDQFSQRMADELEELIQREGPDTIAAFWADPVQGNAGALPPPKGYFEKVQKILRKYDILFVVDEVVCGFGRTGEMWGSVKYGLEPDMVTSAKALSAAMQPISAVLINQKVFDVMVSESDRLGSFIHGFTYSGHPVASAVALEVLRIYEEMDVVGRVKALEGKFLGMLSELSMHPLIGHASGVGLLGGLDVVADRVTRAPFAKEAAIGARFEAAARKRGLILRFMGDRLTFSPPLIISEAELDEIAVRARAAMDDVYATI